MIIKIKDEDTNLTIPLPAAALMNPATASIVSSIIQKHSDIKISSNQLNVLFKAYKKATWYHRGMMLVDVQDADGSSVQIIL